MTVTEGLSHTEMDVLAVLPTLLSAGFLTCHQVNLTARGWGLFSIPTAQFSSLPHGHFMWVCFPFTQWQCQCSVRCFVFTFENLHSYTKTFWGLDLQRKQKAMGTSVPCFRVSFKPMMDIIRSNYKKNTAAWGWGTSCSLWFSHNCWIWEVLSTL